MPKDKKQELVINFIVTKCEEQVAKKNLIGLITQEGAALIPRAERNN
jgi:hypothetical protein